MKKTVLVALVMLLVFSLVMIGCTANIEESAATPSSEAASVKPSDAGEQPAEASQEASAEKKKVGIVQPDFTSPYYQSAAQVWDEAAEVYGLEVIKQSADGSLENEISIIENFIEMGVDAIIEDPMDADAVKDVVQRAVDAGIIVVSLRSPTFADGNYNCIIDNYYAMNGVAYAAFEALGGKGDVVYMQGMVGHECSESREAGFMEALSHYPDINLMDVQPCDWDPTKATTVTESWLAKYDKIDCIFGCTDSATPSILNAVKQAGRMDEIMVTGCDGEKPMLEEQLQGNVVSNALYGSTRDAFLSITCVDALLRGIEIPETVVIPTYIVCSKEQQANLAANVETPWPLVATPEEAIAMTQNYKEEFMGYFENPDNVIITEYYGKK